MRDLYPENEALRKAVRWISDQRQAQTDIQLSKLIENAVFKFDLTPQESWDLYEFYRTALEKKQ
jgi:hypothetical protein